MKESLGSRIFVFPTPTWVVGTFGVDGEPNAMTAAWGGVCCSRPPCVYVSLREATYTHGNILRRRAFTINIPSENYVKEADFFGTSSGRDTEKFSVTGLTPVKSSLVDAPYVEEFPLTLECRVLQVVEIGLHTQFIGQIMDVKAETSVLNEKGVPEVKEVRPIIYETGNRRYYKVGSFLGNAFSIGKEEQIRPD